MFLGLKEGGACFTLCTANCPMCEKEAMGGSHRGKRDEYTKCSPLGFFWTLLSFTCGQAIFQSHFNILPLSIILAFASLKIFHANYGLLFYLSNYPKVQENEKSKVFLGSRTLSF
jgi:hypothetical protein